MKKLFLASTVVFALAAAHGQTTFQKAYGGANTEGSWCVQQTSDGGYIITAESLTFSPLSNYIVKTDSVGTILWTKALNGRGYGNFIIQTLDGGYITNGQAFHLIKMNGNGNVLWSKAYGALNIDEAFSLQQTSDTGFILAGFTGSFGAGQNDIYLVKTDSAGNVLWTKTYGGVNNEGIQGYGNISVQQTPDGGYIINGYTNSFGAGNYDFYVLKTDNIGNLQWSKTYGGTNTEYGYGNYVGETGDGCYVIVGLTQSFGSGLSDVYFLKISVTGNVIWAKTYGGTGDDYGYSVQQTFDGGYIITGATSSFGAGNFDVYLIRTDINGNMLWSKTFGGLNGDYGYSVQQTADSGFVITGYTFSFGSGASDVYLIKTDANGNVGCYESSPATLVTIPTTIVTTPATVVTSSGTVTNPTIFQNNGGIETVLCLTTGIQTQTLSDNAITIFPNPFSTQTVVQTNYPLHNATLTVYNLHGQTVAQIKNLSGQTITFNRDNPASGGAGLPSGLYFIRLTENDKTFATEKLVITDR